MTEFVRTEPHADDRRGDIREPETMRRCAALYRSGWSLRRLAQVYGVSKDTIHRAIRAAGTPMRRPGQVVVPMLAPAPPDPVIDYGERFAYSGRCGACLQCHGPEAPCVAVRVSELTS